MARILLVDDDEAILGVLARALRGHDHDCVCVVSGEDALERYDDGCADMAIVDICLPGIDGVEVTRQLKERAGAEFLPVLMLTGTAEISDRLRAFKQGGCDDFLAKPVNLLELEARVASLLARREAHRELAEANQRLVEAQKKKKDLAALVVHDLRNPLSAIQGNLELVLEDFEDGGDFVGEALSDCHKLAQRALFMVAGLLDVEELSEGLLKAHWQPVEVEPLLSQVTPHHEATVRMREISVAVRVRDRPEARLDPDLVGRMVENLLDNAVRYAPRGGNVVIEAELADDALVIRVGNDGPPVPDAERERIFGRYYRLEARRAGARANRGLGLYFCKLVAEAHGGTIDVIQTDELPACFVVRIPQPRGSG